MSPSVPDPAHVPMCDVTAVGRVHLRTLPSLLLNHCSVESLCGDFLLFFAYSDAGCARYGSMDNRKLKRRHASPFLSYLRTVQSLMLNNVEKLDCVQVPASVSRP